ncbi:MAG TPA: hypothetical protein VIG51_12760 [Candidatus Baltobacteraceae bacterium]|jgi:hypothetical protein
MESPHYAPPLFVEALRGRVLRHGLCKPLSGDQLQLCIALALHRDGVPRERLCEQLFPEMEAEAAMGRLKICVHGVRTQLGADSIIFFQDGYRFSAGFCTSDLDQIEELLGEAGAGRCGEGTVKELLRDLREPRPPYYATWSWFAPIEERIVALTREACRFMGAPAC